MTRLRRRASDDQGFFALWTAILTVAFMGLVGLVSDVGRVLNERSRAFGAAAAAGRIGAQAIDEDAVLLTGDVQLDEDAAEDAARAYLRERGFTGDEVHVDADGLEVLVEVSGESDLRMLGGSVHYEMQATVRAVQSGGPAGG